MMDSNFYLLFSEDIAGVQQTSLTITTFLHFNATFYIIQRYHRCKSYSQQSTDRQNTIIKAQADLNKTKILDYFWYFNYIIMIPISRCI